MNFQALLTPALLHKIDLRGYSDSFCDLVSNEFVCTQYESLQTFIFSTFFVEVLKFSTQCIHQKVDFTAFGLFTVDFSMILTVL